jgi:hypothetical protein|mmetsp:Transcript_9416/g.17674  ORF Transcript_9416/g.17674 Transcript_9416/m.17674 type:complete len:230 (+) Transcript_9416:2243-2932(+)
MSHTHTRARASTHAHAHARAPARTHTILTATATLTGTSGARERQTQFHVPEQSCVHRNKTKHCALCQSYHEITAPNSTFLSSVGPWYYFCTLWQHSSMYQAWVELAMPNGRSTLSNCPKQDIALCRCLVQPFENSCWHMHQISLPVRVPTYIRCVCTKHIWITFRGLYGLVRLGGILLCLAPSLFPTILFARIFLIHMGESSTATLHFSPTPLALHFAMRCSRVREACA